MDYISLGFTVANHGLLLTGQLLRAGSASLAPWLLLSPPGAGVPLCFVLPLLLLPLVALLQLLYMRSRPQTYQRHRLAITAINRLVRLAILCSHAVAWKEHFFACSSEPIHHQHHYNMYRFIHQTNSSSSSSGGSSSSSSSSSSSTWLVLLKYLVAPHLIFLNHANFWLPWRYSLPLQLATLAVQLLMSCRLCVCRMAGSEGLQPAVQATCRGLRKAAEVAAGFLLGGIQLLWQL
ncbi:hypothetical protein OEZ86_007105 [Tetradesmus obliquus]|nr:hypothetical protein OEZ86_007105 [Tetradesmus obliquus]